MSYFVSTSSLCSLCSPSCSLQSSVHSGVNRKLEVLLPRFLLERSYSLSDVLQALDITKVFQDDADINMGGAKGSKLTQVSVIGWLETF